MPTPSFVPLDAPIPPASPARRLAALPEAIVRLCAQFEHEQIGRTDFLEQCTRVVSAAFGCSRVGIWVFVETAEAMVLRCVAMHDTGADRTVLAPDETRNVEPYFRALEQPGFVMAPDTRSHAAITGSFADRLETRGVQSLLAASFSINGAVYGAFTCTQVGSRIDWTPQQLASLRQVAARSSLTLFRRSRYTPSTGLGPLAA